MSNIQCECDCSSLFISWSNLDVNTNKRMICANNTMTFFAFWCFYHAFVWQRIFRFWMEKFSWEISSVVEAVFGFLFLFLLFCSRQSKKWNLIILYTYSPSRQVQSTVWCSKCAFSKTHNIGYRRDLVLYLYVVELWHRYRKLKSNKSIFH